MSKFDYFMILAEMRTGSNFLEANLNELDGVTCHGEAFNPSFIGYPKLDQLLGMTLEDREQNPHRLLEAIVSGPDLGGFRFFNDHDGRILNACLPDPKCAKVILTRNPLDSFVSWKIAKATGQWKLTNATHFKSEQIIFEAEEFEAYLETVQAFQVRVLNALQKVGQTAFYLAYEDLQDIDVMNGLAAFLGTDARLASLNKKLKKQNPQAVSDKVANFSDLEAGLARLDRFNLGRTPNFEPRRGPAIPTYVAAPKSGLLYMPLRSGPHAAVVDWLAAVDGAPVGDVLDRFSQKTLRHWMRSNEGHRSFTVLRHPVARAHAAFCDRVLFDGPGSFPEIRATLRKVHKLPIPPRVPDPDYDEAAHRVAFLAFLRFLRSNLSGQTSVRIDPSWASQLTLLEGMAQFALPDMIVREEQLQSDLAVLARQVGISAAPDVIDSKHPHDDSLVAVYDDEVETAVRDAYPRDYVSFGFGNWA
ncbi:sulfotransferase family 2 domain-containing protein [Yoonia sp.]|uniref:sulfotransferase family 2 domain-containing protein n=1 Tax=Yoonia sp. TaxID=2212373 RepID=UPI0025D951B1|nr:sulfotransferase family 2 domain-containing protein [Yoonia sp.]